VLASLPSAPERFAGLRPLRGPSLGNALHASYSDPPTPTTQCQADPAIEGNEDIRGSRG
jgi:hypothetical protein